MYKQVNKYFTPASFIEHNVLSFFMLYVLFKALGRSQWTHGVLHTRSFSNNHLNHIFLFKLCFFLKLDPVCLFSIYKDTDGNRRMIKRKTKRNQKKGDLGAGGIE